MTPEKQRIAIAEACGIARLWSTALPERTVHCDVPNYLNDLNAMHEAEIAVLGSDWDEEPWARYKHRLYQVIEPHRHVLNSTAAQRAEAFLRTLGKWEEST